MTLRYGLNNTKEYTQKEVAEMLGISQSYISRIEKKVVRKLKQVMIRWCKDVVNICVKYIAK